MFYCVSTFYYQNFQQTVEAWRLIFIITLVIFFIECAFYAMFASGEQQEWAKPKKADGQNEHKLLEASDSKGPA